jgi:hypothetical protein
MLEVPSAAATAKLVRVRFQHDFHVIVFISDRDEARELPRRPAELQGAGPARLSLR